MLIIKAPTLSFGFTHRPLSSSFLGLPDRILNLNHNKELLRGLWVEFRICGSPAQRQQSDDRLRALREEEPTDRDLQAEGLFLGLGFRV